MSCSHCSVPPARIRCSPSNCSDHARSTSAVPRAGTARCAPRPRRAGPATRSRSRALPARLRRRVTSPPARRRRRRSRRNPRRRRRFPLLPVRDAARDDAHDEHQADPEGQGRGGALALGDVTYDSAGKPVQCRSRSARAASGASSNCDLPADPAQLQRQGRRRHAVRRSRQAEARQLLQGQRLLRAVHPAGVPALSDLSAPHAGEPPRAAARRSPTPTARAARRRQSATRSSSRTRDSSRTAVSAKIVKVKGAGPGDLEREGARARLYVRVLHRQSRLLVQRPAQHRAARARPTAACCPSRTTSISRAR